MIALSSRFVTNDLEHLAKAVPKYPISIKSLIGLASRRKLSPEVINFYRAFPDSAVFDNEDDMITRTEQVGLLMTEEKSQPAEDQVRGAED